MGRFVFPSWRFSVPCALSLAVGCLAPPEARAEAVLHILNWGGDFSEAQIASMAQPFQQESGARVVMVDTDDPAMPVLAQHRAGQTTADLASLSAADAQRLCDEGALARLEGLDLSPGADGTIAAEDFLPGGLGPCFVATDIYSTVIAYDASAFEQNPPKSPADFFNLTAFPGKRGLRAEAYYNLELALMALGVPPDQVYRELSTKEGVDRAFAKLDTIKDHIVWWDAGAQPVQLLSTGEVSMTAAYNGRIFKAIHDEDRPFGLLWSGQLYEIEGWGVLADAPEPELAREFVRFSTRPEILANMAEQISYGPPRRSSMALVGRYARGEIEMAPHLPTAPENLANGLAADPEFWTANKEALNARFAAWRLGG